MRYGKTFFKYVFLNMAVVIFSLAALIPVYYQWVQADQQKQLTETFRQTEAGFRDFLSSLQSIENASYILARNSLYQETSRLDSNYNSTCYVDVSKLRRYISELFFAHKDIMADFILTFHRSGIVITSNRVYLGGSEMYPDYFKYPNYTKYEYHYMTQYTNGQEKLGKSQYTYSVENKMKKTITYLIPLKMQGQRNEVVLEILLDAERVQESFFDPQPGSEGQTTLLDFEGEPIMATNYRYNDKSLYEEPFQPIKVTSTGGNERVAVFSLESPDSFYRLYSVRPMSEYSEEMGRILSLLAIYLVAALGISLIAALLNSLWQYKPTQLVAKMLHQVEGERFRDDYSFLYSGMMKIQNEREHLTADIVQAKDRLAGLRFSQMLLEGGAADELAVKLPACCLCLNFWHDGEFELAEEKILEYFTPAGAVTLFRLSPRNLFLVLDTALCSEAQAVESAGAAVRDTSESLFCGFSPAERGEITDAYHRSVYTLHFRAAQSARPAERILLESPSQITDSRDILSENRRERLASFLLGAQVEEAMGILAELQMETKRCRPSRKALQYLYIGISDVLTRVIGQRQLSLEIVGIEEIDLRQSIGQLFERFGRLAEAICQEVTAKRRSANIGLREDILRYIQENFMQPELYNGGIAERFQISDKYLSEFFREQTGGSVGKYIEKLRLDYACKLILESDFSMKEIGEKCGFHNQSTFYKSFNRVYGISPKQYKSHE